MEHLAPVLALFHGKWNRLEHPIKKPAKSQQKQSVPLEHRSLRRGISKPLISGVPFHRGYYSKIVEHPRAGQAWPCPSRRGQIGPRERSAGHVSRSVKSERAMSSRRARHELEPAPLRQGIYASQTRAAGMEVGCIAGDRFVKVSESPMLSMKPVRLRSGRVPKAGHFRRVAC